MNNNKFTLKELKISIEETNKRLNEKENLYETYYKKILKSQSYKFFMKKGFNESDAIACALALQIYTGETFYLDVHKGVCAILRQTQNKKLLYKVEIFLPYFYFMTLALSQIDYFWGKVMRTVEFDNEINDFKIFQPGNIVTFLQFNSSKRIQSENEDPPKCFKHRNTKLIIHSLTGRDIQRFSDFSLEREVLFPPYSTFLVLQLLERKSKNEKNFIYLRQVELGITNKTILWCDDNIFNEKWENKKDMEKLTSMKMNENIHFICKPNTELGVAFLESPFGLNLKNSAKFRIVTDLTRFNERSSNDAGARFIKEVRELKYNNEILLYTKDEKVGKKVVEKTVPKDLIKNIYISDKLNIALKFLNFEKM